MIFIKLPVYCSIIVKLPVYGSFTAWASILKTIRTVTCNGITARIIELHKAKRSALMTTRIMELRIEKRSKIITARIMELQNNKQSYCYWCRGFDAHILCRGWVFVVVVICIDEHFIKHRIARLLINIVLCRCNYLSICYLSAEEPLVAKHLGLHL